MSDSEDLPLEADATPRFEHFAFHATGQQLLTYVRDDGRRIYEDADGDWRHFPRAWKDGGRLLGAEEACVDDGRIPFGPSPFQCLFPSREPLRFPPRVLRALYFFLSYFCLLSLGLGLVDCFDISLRFGYAVCRGCASADASFFFFFFYFFFFFF
jgi:hypothetical protein